MKGSIGTSMNSIQYVPKKKYNHFCKECKYLMVNIYTNDIKNPYYCILKKQGRHYTSKVMCNKFAKKDNVKYRLIKKEKTA